MKFDDCLEKLNQIEKLIAHANTGSPKDLAKKLHISERTVRRLVEKLKMKNSSIKFCRQSNSYVSKN